MDYTAQAQQLLDVANAVLANPDASYSSVSSAQKLAVRISDFLSLYGTDMDAAAGGQDSMVSSLSSMVDQLVSYSSGNSATLQKNSTLDGSAAFGNSLTESLNNVGSTVGNAVNSVADVVRKVDPTSALANVSSTVIVVAICAVLALYFWKKPAT